VSPCYPSAKPKDLDFWSKFVGRDSYYIQNDIPENFYQRDTASASNRFAIALLQRFDFRHPAVMALFIGIFCR
jgi:hypothetical protein